MIRFAMALILAAGCSKSKPTPKPTMTRGEACELLADSSCASIALQSNDCSSASLDAWHTDEWRAKLNPAATPHTWCEKIITDKCCEKAPGPKDCTQHLDITEAEAVVPAPKAEQENIRVRIDEFHGGRVNHDKLAAPLGNGIVDCARKANESGPACTPTDLDWLVTCVAQAKP